MAAGMLNRVVARDVAMFQRFRMDSRASAARRAFWSMITHLGGTTSTLLSSMVPIWFDNPLREGARRAAIILVASHVVVQILKRTVSRARPASAECIVNAPDRYSFPSGHAAASLSIAVGFASAHPTMAAPLIVAAGVVGASRVVLGVHFPADVLTGQMIALMTAAAVAPIL